MASCTHVCFGEENRSDAGAHPTKAHGGCGKFDGESWLTHLWIFAIFGSPANAQAITAQVGMRVEG